MLKTIQRRKFNSQSAINAEIVVARREIATGALEAKREMQRISELNGNSEMTLEEINAEIAAARRDMDARRA